MGTKEVMFEEIRKLFDSAQVTSARHQKNAILLKRLLENYTLDKSLPLLTTFIHTILLSDYKEKNIHTERLLNFIALFCTTLKPQKKDDEIIDHPIFRHIFEQLLECQNVKNDSVRYWSCKFLAKIFETTDEISNNLFICVKDVITDRLQDVRAVIRYQAVLCLYRLQDPTDNDDIIIKQFLERINTDLNSKVRLLCLQKIAIRKDTLPCLLDRIRDVDVNVRIAAFEKVNKLMPYLTISQRQNILICGFMDSSDKIRKFVCTNFIEAWLVSYKNNYMDLIKCLRLDASEKDINKSNILIEQTLNALFREKTVPEIKAGIKLNPKRLIDFKELNFESALYWRVMIQYFRKNDELEDVLNSVLPDLVNFCDYIKSYCEYMENDHHVDLLHYQFILKQMFLITEGCDVSDTCSRQRLNNVIRFIFENTEVSLDVAEIMMANLRRTISNVDSRCGFVSEIISNIMYDGQEDEEKAQQEAVKLQQQIFDLKRSIDSYKDQQSKAISQKNYMEAERLKNQIKDTHLELDRLRSASIDVPETTVVKRTDDETIMKYLTVTRALLKSPDISYLNPFLATIKREVVTEVLMHPNDDIRANAFMCYALGCLVDINSARNGVHLFSVPIYAYLKGEECNIKLLIVCLSAVVDLLVVFGSGLMAEPDENEETKNDSAREEHIKIFAGGSSLTELIQGIVDLMHVEEPEVQEMAAKGLCALLIHNRIHSPKVVSYLVLKWASPATDEDIKQYIGTTLDYIYSIPGFTENFEDAIILTVKTLVYAPGTSPLAQVNVENIAKFMFALCQGSPQERQVHSKLALELCHIMQEKPNVKVNYYYAKLLLMVKTPTDEFVIKQLLEMCDDLKDTMRDKQTTNYLTKFVARLNLNKFDNDNDDDVDINHVSVNVSGIEQIKV